MPHIGRKFAPTLLPTDLLPLSSDAKCNTPRRFDIGKVVQDLKECCHAILFASVGGRKRPDRVLRAAGRSMGAIARALGRAKATISRELQRNALPSGGIRRFTPPEPINCAGGVKRSSNERPLYACSWGSARRGMDARTDLRLVEIAGTNRGCGPSAARQSTPSSIGPHRRPRPCGAI